MCEKRFETDPGTVKFDGSQNTLKIKPMLNKGKAWLLVSSVHFLTAQQAMFSSLMDQVRAS